MAELKTKVTKASASAFLDTIKDPVQKADAKKLLALFKKITKEQPKMWGAAIIGFGQYHYKSERSSQEGDWLITGFSPRKQNLTLYVMPGIPEKMKTDLLKKLGKCKASGGCLYIKRLADVDETVLTKLIRESSSNLKKRYSSSIVKIS